MAQAERDEKQRAVAENKAAAQAAQAERDEKRREAEAAAQAESDAKRQAMRALVRALRESSLVLIHLAASVQLYTTLSEFVRLDAPLLCEHVPGVCPDKAAAALQRGAYEGDRLAGRYSELLSSGTYTSTVRSRGQILQPRARLHSTVQL